MRLRLIACLLALPATALAAPAPTPEPTVRVAPPGPLPDPAAELHLVYTGGTGGLGTDRYAFGIHRQIASVALTTGLDVERSTIHHAVLHQNGHTLLPVSGGVADIATFAAAGTPRCDPPESRTALRTATELAVLPNTTWASEFRAVRDATPLTVDLHRCHAGGVEAWSIEEPGTDPIVWSADAFDVRMALGIDLGADEEAGTVLVIGRPRLEAARRAHRLLSLRHADATTLFVDAGDFVDGPSTVDFGKMSLHRPTGFALLQRLTPTALVPGANELAPGPKTFLAEARAHDLPYVATNWSTDDDTFDLPDVVRRTVPTARGPIDVAFLGVIDPRVQEIVSGLTAEGVTLTDPVAAISDVVDALEASDDPPDLVVVLAFASPELQSDLRRALYGVDLLIGDRWAATFRRISTTYALRDVPRTTKAAPVTLPMDGVATATIRFGTGEGPVVEIAQAQITAEDPADDAVRAAVTGVRLRALPGVDDVLIPANVNDPLTVVSDEQFAKLVCEAVLEATGADVVALPALPEAPSMPGPLTTAQAAERLAVLDKLELHRIDGDRANDVFELLGDAVPIGCGADIGVRAPKVGGRSVDAQRTYLLVSTDRARITTSAGAALDSGNAGLVLQLPKVQPMRHSDGTPLTLLEVAITQMRAWRDAEGLDAWTAPVLALKPSTKTAAWMFDVDQLSFQVSTFGRTERPEAYAQVPETLINSPNSFTLGGALDTTVRHDGLNLSWDARALASYTRLVVDDGDPQETADDWQISTSLLLPLARFPRNKTPNLMPYFKARYDSEFTPLDDADGNALPRQADLSGTVGLSASAWRWLKRLRLGAFVNQDMERLPGNASGLPAKGVETGGRLEVQTQHDLAKASSVRIKTNFDGQVFANTAFDDAADLRMRLFGEVRLQLRLIRWLNVSVFAQGLAAQGRVAETSQVVASGTVGAALDMSTSVIFGRQDKARR